MVEVTLNSPLAEALGNIVQPKLSEVGWSTGGLDDSALTEYIILMLVNGKTQEQIAAELSNDLLNLEPHDSGAIEFARWLFDQVEQLHIQLNGGPQSQVQAGQQSHDAQPQYDNTRLSRQGSKQSNGSADSPDTEMGEALPNSQDGAIPTGPKSMRNGGRNNHNNNNRRLIGQLSKAMDRSNDAVLHRVRPQQGTERINMHNRQPPKGPRIDQARNGRPLPNGRPTAMQTGRIPNGTPGSAIPQMSPQQQMQLLALYEEQARMMSRILAPSQMFMPGLPQPAVNPAFNTGMNQQSQQPGRSLFERVEANPRRQHGQFSKRQQTDGGSPYPSNPSGITKPSDSQQISNGDISSSMEVESSQTTTKDFSPDTTCRFNLSCTKKDCPYAHQSPAAPPGAAITIDVNDSCPFGAACKNRKCVGRHPSPAQKANHQSEQDCKFFPNCTNPTCTFRHPTMPMCRNGADCTREACKFTHVNITCKYNPCLNATCPYKHAEGQKRGAFNDKVWVADGEKEHVSERKFIDDDAEGEELVVPDIQVQGSQEIVT